MSLEPPQASVTALAVSHDESPTLYVATFRSSDHVALLWTYHDTGGPPQGPPGSPSPVVSASRISTSANSSKLLDVLSSSQMPYIGLGLGALLVILTAVVAHVRARHR